MCSKRDFIAKIMVIVIAGLSGYIGVISTVTAQNKTLDYLGEINDGDHPPGYREYVEMGCWQCHGFQGQGAGDPPLIASLLPYEAFANQTRRPRNVMPAYSPNVLSDAQLQRIYQYLENIPPAPDVINIPLLPAGR